MATMPARLAVLAAAALGVAAVVAVSLVWGADALVRSLGCSDGSVVTAGDEWVGPDGSAGRDTVIVSCGPRHCDWESTQIASIDWEQLGDEGPGRDPYVRDPAAVGLDGDQVAGAYEEDALLPEDARDTGYASTGVELWVAPERDAIFFAGPDRVERWPQLRVGCA
jgi:hypothetical protein